MMVRIAAVLLFAIGGVSCGAPAADARPSRSDCLVKLEFPAGYRDDHQVDGMAIAFELGLPLAAYGAKGESMYLQFDQSCGRRKAFAERWLAEFEARSGRDLGGVVSDERVVPGRKTMDVRGEAWRD